MKSSRKRREPRRYATQSTNRHAVAVEAARLLYRREYKEYYQAKREAARRYGCKVLPTNSEIHRQILLIADRTEGQARTQRLGEMRSVALELMELLEAFQPRLIGSTWTGHIRKGSDVDLHLHSDELGDVLLQLDSRDLSYQVETVRSRRLQKEMEFIHVRLTHPRGFEVEMTVYPTEWLKTHPKCSITGGPMARATLPELRQRMEQEHSELQTRPLPSPQGGLGRLLLPLARIDELLPLMPELSACAGVQQNHYHHLDVLGHTVEVVRALERFHQDKFRILGPLAAPMLEHLESPGPDGWTRQAVLSMAALCHDIGKPRCWSLHRSGRIRFLGHETEGAGMTRAMLSRLDVPALSAEGITRLVRLHMEPVLIPSRNGPPSRMYRLFREARELMPELLLLSLADVSAARGPAQPADRLTEQALFVKEMLEEYFEQGFLRFPTCPVSAVDLQCELGVTEPGLRERALARLTEAYVDGEFEGREDGLMWAAELLETPASTW